MSPLLDMLTRGLFMPEYYIIIFLLMATEFTVILRENQSEKNDEHSYFR